MNASIVAGAWTEDGVVPARRVGVLAAGDLALVFNKDQQFWVYAVSQTAGTARLDLVGGAAGGQLVGNLANNGLTLDWGVGGTWSRVA